jgi:hypothetical protein
MHQMPAALHLQLGTKQLGLRRIFNKEYFQVNQKSVFCLLYCQGMALVGYNLQDG